LRAFLQLNNLLESSPKEDKKIFEELSKDLKRYFENHASKENRSDLWTQRMIDARDLLFKNNNVNKTFFRNFRSTRRRLIADTPKPKNIVEKIFYKQDRLQAKYQFKKILTEEGFIKLNMFETMKKFRFDLVGNPGYLIDSNFIYSERYIRHCYYISLFETHICPELNDENKYYLFDIGGGYGIFGNFILKLNKNIKPIVVDLPEQLFTAYYYFKKNYPDLKINHVSDCLDKNELTKEFLDNYDICLIPAEKFEDLKITKNIIISNFNSFGEFSRKIFQDYQDSLVFQNLDFLFTHNRLDSFPTYEDEISIFDYNLDKYRSIFKGISPIFDYVFQKKMFFLTKKVPFGSRCFTFIGSSKD